MTFVFASFRSRIWAAAIVVPIALSLSALGSPAAGADKISDGQWYLNYLDVSAAHKISQGEGVRIAVIDTGIDPNHPDIRGSVEPGVDVRQFPASGDGLTDDDGHGTSMASLIVGHGRIRGIAPKATVVSLKYADSVSSSPTAMGSAINWAVEHGVKVISISAAHVDRDLVLQQAVEKAILQDVVIIASAGNKPEKSAIEYPAAFPGVVAVSGIGSDGQLWSSSVTGPEVLLSAPAKGISTAWRDNRRVVTDGTSNSAAIVAGMVALIRAKYPTMPATEVIRRLISTATDKGPAGRDSAYGFGVPNLVAALTAPAVSASAGRSVAPSQIAPTRIDAPGAEFPLRTALFLGGGCLTIVILAVGLVVMVVRRRRPE
ncbi:type VII secretion-associated serine protease [Catellatospora sp. TT07R-123]|uniref:S8 family serine peptidase n=1 Tax=Catellatospora sp. TT07R-123 TaxID=2733863 RepID=UPI001B205F3B|nr:S8 family serine peptidase [Catellatospora sp. TT07R-123]GHJ49192.1 type VII secretion-associated serine protease [Catellatospora sp. TT07R-123]